jgi:hypothetical protein
MLQTIKPRRARLIPAIRAMSRQCWLKAWVKIGHPLLNFRPFEPAISGMNRMFFGGTGKYNGSESLHCTIEYSYTRGITVYDWPDVNSPTIEIMRNPDRLDLIGPGGSDQPFLPTRSPSFSLAHCQGSQHPATDREGC